MVLLLSTCMSLSYNSVAELRIMKLVTEKFALQSLMVTLLFALSTMTASAFFTPELLIRAEGGDASAQYELGECYLKGDGIKKNGKNAIKWLTLAADNGVAKACYDLGYIYYFGIDTKKNPQKSYEWAKKGADLGNDDCRNLFAVCLNTGTGIAQNKDEAQKIFTELADPGHLTACINLAAEYYNSKDYPLALKYLHPVVESGDPVAQYVLGEMYMYGRGVEVDEAKAALLYKMAADQSYADAQFELGNCYFMGYGVGKSLSLARKYWNRAANQGHKEAARQIYDTNY